MGNTPPTPHHAPTRSVFYIDQHPISEGSTDHGSAETATDYYCSAAGLDPVNYGTKPFVCSAGEYDQIVRVAVQSSCNRNYELPPHHRKRSKFFSEESAPITRWNGAQKDWQNTELEHLNEKLIINIQPYFIRDKSDAVHGSSRSCPSGRWIHVFVIRKRD